MNRIKTPDDLMDTRRVWIGEETQIGPTTMHPWIIQTIPYRPWKDNLRCVSKWPAPTNATTKALWDTKKKTTTLMLTWDGNSFGKAPTTVWTAADDDPSKDVGTIWALNDYHDGYIRIQPPYGGGWCAIYGAACGVSELFPEGGKIKYQ